MASISDILGMTGEVADIFSQTVSPYMMDVWRQRENDYNANARAMVAAGAGILAGNKGNYGAAMPAIGQGLGAGMETYNQIRALQYTNALKQAQLQANALKARELADYRRQQIALGQQREADITDIRKEREADKRTAEQQRHEDKLVQLQNQRDIAAERAQTAKDALEERYFRDQEMAAQRELDREMRRDIAGMRLDATAAGRQPKTITNATDDVFRVSPDGQLTPIIDPTTGKQMKGQPKGGGTGKDPFERYLKIWRQRKADYSSSQQPIPPEMVDPYQWLQTPEGKAIYEGEKQGAGTSDFNPTLPGGYSARVIASAK